MPNNFRTPPLALLLQDAEGTNSAAPDKLQLFRIGKFSHPMYGKFEISKETLAAFKKNFDNKVRRIDLALDYKHENQDVAAAWFKELELSQDGTELWTKVGWTRQGKQKVEDKEFRYVSPEFTFDYQDAETGNTFGPTVLGAGLTNRPFIKEMAPATELSEITKEGEPTMNEIEKLQKENKDLNEKVLKLEETVKAHNTSSIETENKDLKAQVVKLQEDAKKEAEAKKATEKKASFDRMLTEGKVCEAQREPFMKDDIAKFTELSKPISLEGKGTSDGGNSDGKKEKTAEDKVVALAEVLIKDKKASTTGQAIRMVLSDPSHKALADEYRKNNQV